MAKSTGETGRGLSIQIGDGGSPEQFVTVANATSIAVQGRDVEEIDFTHLLSDGGYREFRPGFKDPGNAPIEFHFSAVEASHIELQAAWLAGTLFTTRIDMSPLGANWNKYFQGEAFVKNPGDLTINVTDPIKGAATLRFTGTTAFVDKS